MYLNLLEDQELDLDRRKKKNYHNLVHLVYVKHIQMMIVVLVVEVLYLILNVVLKMKAIFI